MPSLRITSRPIEYAELHCLTNYTFLTGASHPEELVAQAAEQGLAALAITDRNSLAGIVRAYAAAKDLRLKLIVGSEILLENGLSLLLWCPDLPAYQQLSRLITLGRMRAKKGDCHLFWDDLINYTDRLLAGVLLTSRQAVNETQLSELQIAFPNRLYGVIELHCGADDRQRLDDWIKIADRFQLPLVAANDVHYHIPERQALQDVLVAIREGCTVAEVGRWQFANAERYLKSPAQMMNLFRRYPELIERTLEIADRCQFSLGEIRYTYPEELSSANETPQEYLERLSWAGAEKRYPDGIPEKIRQSIRNELALIGELGYASYFLTVWDVVRFARKNKILCQGRGSAANSVVCYCLGVTSVDPTQIDLLFERFISKERQEAPDIDIDFEHQRREEVLQYLYNKYGRERAGMTAVVIRYRAKSSIRDVGKALGLSLPRVSALSKLIGYHIENSDQLIQRCQEAGLDPETQIVQQLLRLVPEIQGFPRHLSQHVGGMILSQQPLCELVPIENATMPGRTVVQWDKDDLDVLGILKVDCLGLGMLSTIRRGLDMLKKYEGTEYTLASVPKEQPEVYKMIQRADTVGVFQIESRAQMTMLPRLKPACFYDLVIEVAIVRPGPIQGKMVHPYLQRRNGLEPITYPTPEIQRVLEKTLGVPLFQEQVMRLAVVAAGFTPGEADHLRRSIASWRHDGSLEKFRHQLVAGMLERNLPEEFAQRVFQQIEGFGQYGFPESHAASFALLVYVSAWLKCHHPAVFTASLLNSLPMGFYAPAQLVRDARNHGVEVRPADINSSEWDCTLEPSETKPPWAIRLGFRLVKGITETDAEKIVQARQHRPYTSCDDLMQRTELPHRKFVQLAESDAFGSLGINRRWALWDTLNKPSKLPLFEGKELSEPAAVLPPMSAEEEVMADYQQLGLSLRSHPMSFVRKTLNRLGVRRCKELAKIRSGKQVQLAGVVLFRQRPSTAKGITFITIEDETGIANLIVHPSTWEKFYRVARTAKALLIEGRVESEHSVIHTIVFHLDDLSDRLQELSTRSRDFR